MADLRERFERLLQSYNALATEKCAQDKVLAGILSSTSWRITAPLRSFAEAKNKILPLFRFGRCPLTVEQCHDLIDDQGTYHISGETPYLILSSDPIPHEWCRLTLVVNRPLYFYLTFDTGNGFSDEHRKFISVGTIDPWTVLRIPEGTRRIRLDPFDNGETFQLSSMTLHPLGNAEAFGWLARAKLGPSPRFWIPKLAKAWRVFRAGGFGAVRQKLAGDEHMASYQEWVEQYDTLTPDDFLAIRALVDRLPSRPTFSVILPVYNTPEEFLRRAIESVRTQIYADWELCICDDASTKPHVATVLAEYASLDSRIKVTRHERNRHISAASNSALALASGDFVALLDHDDELRPHALAMVAHEICTHPHADLIYSDEDKITTYGLRFNPYFKSDWNPELFLQQNFICHLVVFRRATVAQVGGFREGFEGSQDWDLTLRVIDSIPESHVRHIPLILYHWRAVEGSTAQSASFKPYALEAGKRAIEEYLARVHRPARVEILDAIAHYRIHDSVPHPAPLVSLIIPTRDKLAVTRRGIESILAKTTYPSFEIVVIDNGSQERETLAYLEELSRNERVKIVRDDSPFNYSRLNNQAIPHAAGTLIGFLNNDLEVISRDWLTEMVAHAVRPNVGAVGARLWYPNGRLQHGGVIIGIGGVAGHNHKGFPRDNVGYFNRAILTQNLSAVTAACLVMRKALFVELGGFEEKELGIAFNDVDLCLRLRAQGFQIVWTPYAELYHYESVSRGYEHTPEKFSRFEGEVEAMKRRWGDTLHRDPFYNPNLSIVTEDFRFAFPPRVLLPWRSNASSFA